MAPVLAVVPRRHPFTAQYRHLRCQGNWWVELERRLAPPAESQPRPTGRSVQRQVKAFLAHVAAYARPHPTDAEVVAPLSPTFRQRWPRLFAGYGWPERYRTNNELATFLGRLRTRQRPMHGRTSGHEFSLRYGEGAVVIDPTEPFNQGLQRFEQIDQAEFDQEYARVRKAQRRLHVLYQFRHHPRRCLKHLEQHWAEAIGCQP